MGITLRNNWDTKGISRTYWDVETGMTNMTLSESGVDPTQKLWPVNYPGKIMCLKSELLFFHLTFQTKLYNICFGIRPVTWGGV